MPSSNSSSTVISTLSRIETNVIYLTESSRKQESAMDDVLDRLARLESSTSRAVPEVDVLRRDVDGHTHRIGALESFKEAHCQDHAAKSKTWGDRFWEIAKALIIPAVGVILGFLYAGGNKGNRLP